MGSRPLLCLALAGFTLAGCRAAAPAPDAAESLPRFMDEFFFQWVQRDPEWFSELRVFGDDVDPYGDLLTDVSPAARRSALRFAAAALEELRRYDLARADEPTRVAAEAFEWYLDDLVRGAPYALHDYPLNQYDGDPFRLIAFMTDVHVVRSALDAENYVLRLSRFDTRIAQLLDGLRERAARGVIPPAPILAKVRSALSDFVSLPPAESPLVRSFAARLETLAGVAPAEREAWVRQAEGEVAGTVYPAYRELLAYTDALGSQAPQRAGVWRLPDGPAYYAHQVRHHTTLDLDPEEVHARGQREVARLQTQLRGVLAALGFEAESFGAAVRAYRASFPETGSFYHPADPAGRARALSEYRALVEGARRALAAIVAAPPKAPVVVEPFPVWQEQGATATTYVPPSLDGHRPGIVYVNLGGPVFRPRMPILAYHEGIPGHHVQLGRQREAAALPTFSRVVSFTAFAEGWAFYAERLMLEAGLYDDAHSAISYLHYELLRSARLVVDTGIHHRRWTREEALDWMRENLGSAEEAQVDRYIVRPGEALAYKIGELEILELRERAREALGPRFDAARFHDAVLRHGSLPLEVLRGAVERGWASGG